MSKFYKVIDGKIVMSSAPNCEISQPAILIDGDTGTVHRVGELSNVNEMHRKLTEAYNTVNCSAHNKFTTIDLSNVDVNAAEYIMNRCLLCSASTFPLMLIKKLGSSEFSAWLSGEMSRVEIN